MQQRQLASNGTDGLGEHHLHLDVLEKCERRTEACQGDGVIKIEMHFLPDVYVKCDQCKGKRYNRETLEVKWRDKSISDVLDMTVSEGAELFKAVPLINEIVPLIEAKGRTKRKVTYYLTSNGFDLKY